MNEKWFLISKNRNMKKSGYGQNFGADVSIYFGSADLLVVTQESKKANSFYGVCLFAFCWELCDICNQ